MDYNTVPAPTFGRSLVGLTLNLLVRDVYAEVSFLSEVLGLTTHRTSTDFAILSYSGQIIQLHADHTYAGHRLPSLLPAAGARGAGIELRLHETDPDAAAARAATRHDAVVLQPPTDKAAHGLREAVILSPSGYAWVPSRRLGE